MNLNGTSTRTIKTNRTSFFFLVLGIGARISILRSWNRQIANLLTWSWHAVVLSVKRKGNVRIRKREQPWNINVYRRKTLGTLVRGVKQGPRDFIPFRDVRYAYLRTNVRSLAFRIILDSRSLPRTRVENDTLFPMRMFLYYVMGDK